MKILDYKSGSNNLAYDALYDYEFTTFRKYHKYKYHQKEFNQLKKLFIKIILTIFFIK